MSAPPPRGESRLLARLAPGQMGVRNRCLIRGAHRRVGPVDGAQTVPTEGGRSEGSGAPSRRDAQGYRMPRGQTPQRRTPWCRVWDPAGRCCAAPAGAAMRGPGARHRCGPGSRGAHPGHGRRRMAVGPPARAGSPRASRDQDRAQTWQDAQIIRRSRAQRVSSRRSESCSLRSTLETWLSTVRSEMNRLEAASR